MVIYYKFIRLTDYGYILQVSLQWCTNPMSQVTMKFKFWAVAPNIYASPIWNMFHVTFLVSRILRWLMYFVYF